VTRNPRCAPALDPSANDHADATCVRPSRECLPFPAQTPMYRDLYGLYRDLCANLRDLFATREVLVARHREVLRTTLTGSEHL
jgi:hypothetical protein